MLITNLHIFWHHPATVVRGWRYLHWKCRKPLSPHLHHGSNSGWWSWIAPVLLCPISEAWVKKKKSILLSIFQDRVVTSLIHRLFPCLLQVRNPGQELGKRQSICNYNVWALWLCIWKSNLLSIGLALCDGQSKARHIFMHTTNWTWALSLSSYHHGNHFLPKVLRYMVGLGANYSVNKDRDNGC